MGEEQGADRMEWAMVKREAGMGPYTGVWDCGVKPEEVSVDGSISEIGLNGPKDGESGGGIKSCIFNSEGFGIECL